MTVLWHCLQGLCGPLLALIHRSCKLPAVQVLQAAKQLGCTANQNGGHMQVQNIVKQQRRDKFTIMNATPQVLMT